MKFTVIDSGIGISEANQKEIFKLFCNPKSGNYQKTSVGLGLSYCKAVITRLKGSINCKSRVGSGTTITFVIEA